MELMFFLLISVSLSVKAYNFETLTNQIALEYKNPGESLQYHNQTIFEMFGGYTYPPSAYKSYSGLDNTALFGSSVATNEMFTVVGSNGYNIFEGIVHVYTPTACSWTLQSYIRSPAGDNGNFGVSVAVYGKRIVVGANSWSQYTGKVFIFKFIDQTYWMHEATLSSPLGVQHGFGFSVAIHGNYTVVGTGRNEAFVYELDAKLGWSLNSQLQPGLDNGANFGHSVSVYGDVIVVGADGIGGSVGAAYIYKLNSSDTGRSWNLTSTLQSVDGYSSYFGHSVDISENTIVVGARGYETLVFNPRGNQTANNSGWAYIYDYNSSTSEWSLSQRLVSPAGQNSYFGESVAIHKDLLIVGADGFPLGDITGSAFTFVRNTSDTTTHANWVFDTALGSAAGAEGHFGYAVDISDTYEAVGAFGHDDLRGGVFMACRDPFPTRSPVPVPIPASVQPTSRPTTNAEKFSGGEFTGTKKNPWPWGLIVAIILAGVTGMAVAGGLAYYGFCRAAPPEVLKKKSKEEEDSPYTVHGAGGLLDDDGSVYGPSDYQSETNGYSSFYSGSDAGSSTDHGSSAMRGDKEKEKKDGNKKGDDSTNYNNNYTVHSYRGYDEQSDSSSVLTESDAGGKGDKKEHVKGNKGGAVDDQSIESKCTVVSYRGYNQQEDSVEEQSSQQSLREKQLEAEQAHSPSFVSSVLTTIKKISPRLFTSPAEPSLATVVEDEDEDVFADSIYPTHPVQASSGDSFFDNDGVDCDDHGDQDNAAQSNSQRSEGYLRSSVYRGQQTIFNTSSGSLDTADSSAQDSLSLVEQARARLALVRNVPLHHSSPLKVVTATQTQDGSDSLTSPPHASHSGEDSSISSEPPTRSLVGEARAHMAAVKRQPAKRSNDLLSPSSQLSIVSQDSVATSSSSLVEGARARGDVIRSMASEVSMASSDSAQSVITLSSGSAMGRANASYASYKLKLEQDDLRRTDEAEALRAALEQTRLQSDDEHQHMTRLDHHDQQGNIGGVSSAQVGEATDSATSDDSSDKLLRWREESRLRAEEKARARFAAFKTLTQQQSAPRQDNQTD